MVISRFTVGGDITLCIGGGGGDVSLSLMLHIADCVRGGGGGGVVRRSRFGCGDTPLFGCGDIGKLVITG